MTNTIGLTYSGPIASVNVWKEPRRGGGMRLTGRYRQFLDDLTMTFRAQIALLPGVPIKKSCSVEVVASLPAAWDLANITKPLFDGLEKAGVVVNDRLITTYIVRRKPEIPKPGTGHLVITIRWTP